MSSLQEIKTAIQSLGEAQRGELLDWLEECGEDAWDRQIAADVRAGRLDQILDRVEANARAGRTTDATP